MFLWPSRLHQSQTDRVISYPEGRYQLEGDGTRVPYYWVWIPTGSSTVPAPPAPPIVPSR
jgi:hypothetical protein